MENLTKEELEDAATRIYKKRGKKKQEEKVMNLDLTLKSEGKVIKNVFVFKVVKKNFDFDMLSVEVLKVIKKH